MDTLWRFLIALGFASAVLVGCQSPGGSGGGTSTTDTEETTDETSESETGSEEEAATSSDESEEEETSQEATDDPAEEEAEESESAVPAPTALDEAHDKWLALRDGEVQLPEAPEAAPELSDDEAYEFYDALNERFRQPTGPIAPGDPARLPKLKARITAGNALVKDYLDRARIRAGEGDLVAAIEDCTAAIESRVDARAYLLRARLLMKADNHRDALDDFNEAFALLNGTEEADQILDRARCKWAMGLPISSVFEDISKALEKKKDNYPPARLMRTVVLEESLRTGFDQPTTEELNRLLADYNTIIGRAPTPTVYLLRGRLHFRLGNWSQALSDLIVARARDATLPYPYDEERVLQGAVFELKQADSEEAKKEGLRKMGVLLLKLGDWQRALPILAGDRPRLVERIAWLGALHDVQEGPDAPKQRQRLTEVALPLWEALFSDTHRGYGPDLLRTYEAAGRQEADRMLASVEEPMKKSASFQILMAELAHHRGEHERANILVDRVLEKAPRYAPAWLLRSYHRCVSETEVEARMEPARVALAIDATSPYYRLEAASALAASGVANETTRKWVEDAAATLGETPEVGRVRLMMAELEGDLESLDAAWQKIRETAGRDLTIEMESRLRRAWFERAQAAIEADDVEAAGQAIERARTYEHVREEDKKLNEGLEAYTIGRWHQEADRIDKAIEFLSKVSKLDETWGIPAHYWLGHAAKKAERTDLARKAWTTYLDKSVEEPEEEERREEVKTQLESLP